MVSPKTSIALADKALEEAVLLAAWSNKKHCPKTVVLTVPVCLKQLFLALQY